MLGGVAWFVAWSRLPFLKNVQPFTFTPQWLAYIIVVEGLTLRRSGRCMMLDETSMFLKLFAGSAFFWWFFEYLNRFVQNWYYLGLEDFSPLEYFLYATPAFATVLPAVLCTSRLLLSFNFFNSRYCGLPRFEFKKPKVLAFLMLFAASASLALIGVFPNMLFPMLWLSPLLLLSSLQIFAGRKTVFAGFREGDLRLFVSLVIAALICGFFWEMWNFHSLAKWIYSVPYVNVFHIFEMPVLGYAGYIPFGLECYCTAQFLLNYESRLTPVNNS
ncbi:MAG: hypothetical protein A2X49_05235 [Lentisphaerae bacterium GWF2_52_8]|nr:MAG: hypothetical protein A2X49_05235 [Lentisphaerae bacterium GWF2_52_8]